MCIAVYKDAKATPVDKKTLKNCWEINRDGAGYAWWDTTKKVWIVRKGFLTWDAFWESFNEHQFQKKDIYVCHFRIGTSGNKRGADCTHPFPLTHDFEEMRRLEFESPNIIMHNGVHGGGEGTISDTMLAIRNWIWALWPMINDEERGGYIQDIMSEGLKMNSNRWLITEGSEVVLVGSWEKDEETGVRYSNTGYKREKVTNYYSYGHGAYGAGGRNWQDPQSRTGTPLIAQATKSGTSRGDGVGRVWSGDCQSKYISRDGSWNWDTWKEDFREHFGEHAILVENLVFDKDGNVAVPSEVAAGAVVPNESEADEKDDDTIVNPNLTKTWQDQPITVMGLVDSNGDVDWEEGYEPAEDMLICPNCKTQEYLVDPKNLRGVRSAADTLCGKCGCMFMDADGKIIGWDLELKEEYRNASRTE